MNQLVNELKENGQDFEWYPTTDRMLQIVADDLNKSYSGYSKKMSLLDIGAGDGRALMYLQKHTRDGFNRLFAIEKSRLLIERIPEDILVIGTDLSNQTLLDKKVDVVFCNPPYSEYSEWVARIIRETPADKMYFVLPERWEKDRDIQEALRARDAAYDILDRATFTNSRERAARVDVHIIKVHRKSTYCSMTDPFVVWFSEHFKGINEGGEEHDSEYRREQRKKEEIKQELVSGGNLIDRLHEMYTRDMNHLLNNYKTLSKLDNSLLGELGVSLTSLCESLITRIQGLKKLYWHELFDRMSSINLKLTVKSREALLERMSEHTSVDFTPDNVYAVVLWVLKNANLYMEEQLEEVFDRLSYPEHVKAYKSNTHFEGKKWRYEKYGNTNYSLDYRIVVPAGAFTNWPHALYNRMSQRALDCVQDVLCVANTLGFVNNEQAIEKEWNPGKENIFYTLDGEELLRVRPFKNGNLHMKFNKDFMLKFNLAVGKQKGWLKSPEHAADEMGISVSKSRQNYGKLNKIGVRDLPLLESRQTNF